MSEEEGSEDDDELEGEEDEEGDSDEDEDMIGEVCARAALTGSPPCPVQGTAARRAKSVKSKDVARGAARTHRAGPVSQPHSQHQPRMSAQEPMPDLSDEESEEEEAAEAGGGDGGGGGGNGADAPASPMYSDEESSENVENEDEDVRAPPPSAFYPCNTLFLLLGQGRRRAMARMRRCPQPLQGPRCSSPRPATVANAPVLVQRPHGSGAPGVRLRCTGAPERPGARAAAHLCACAARHTARGRRARYAWRPSTVEHGDGAE